VRKTEFPKCQPGTGATVCPGTGAASEECQPATGATVSTIYRTHTDDTFRQGVCRMFAGGLGSSATSTAFAHLRKRESRGGESNP
jgi:hypothetical protein